MRLLDSALTVAIAAVAAAGLPSWAIAQGEWVPKQAETDGIAAAQSQVSPPSTAQSQQVPLQEPADLSPAAMRPAAPPRAMASAQTAGPDHKTYTVPAGTKVLLQLRSAINTKSAKQGDGVYLESTFPVVVGNRVLIPEGVYVQGMIDRIVRAGHVKGKSQLDMHFTSIIFPNGTVVEIPGIVNSLPGANKQSVKADGEGTIEQSADKGRNAGEVAKIAIPTGGTIGSIGGLAGGHPVAGGVAGIGAGLAAAGLVSLFTRGADVNIPNGAQVEMLLQRPLLLEEANLSGAPPVLVPTATQPRPLDKPGRAHLLCPPGGLGCQ